MEVFLVFVYTDYRKNITTKMVKIFEDRNEAIQFAKFWAKEYADVYTTDKSMPKTFQHRGQYNSDWGTEFDGVFNWKKIQKLLDQGIEVDPDIIRNRYNVDRIGVSKVSYVNKK